MPCGSSSPAGSLPWSEAPRRSERNGMAKTHITSDAASAAQARALVRRVAQRGPARHSSVVVIAPLASALRCRRPRTLGPKKPKQRRQQRQRGEHREQHRDVAAIATP